MLFTDKNKSALKAVGISRKCKEGPKREIHMLMVPSSENWVKRAIADIIVMGREEMISLSLLANAPSVFWPVHLREGEFT